MQKSSMAKMDNRVFESAASASQPAIKARKNELSKEDVMLIQEDQKNRGSWNIEIVIKLNRGRDRAVQSTRIKCGKSILERAIQPSSHPRKLSCDLVMETEKYPAILNLMHENIYLNEWQQ